MKKLLLVATILLNVNLFAQSQNSNRKLIASWISQPVNKNIAAYYAEKNSALRSIVLDAPTHSSPANGATGQSINTVVYWNAVSGATRYQLDVGTSPGATNIYVNDYEYGTSKDLTGYLSYSTTYYWAIWAFDGTWSASSGSWSFTTEALPPPDPPTLSSPSNGATNQSTNTTVSWNTSGNGRYQLDVGTYAGGTNIYSNSNVYATSYNLNGLLSTGTTYYWKVYAYNGYWSSASSEWSFTTGSPPSTPTLGTPSNGATGVTLNSNVTWSDGGGSSSYYLQVSTTSDCSSGYTVNGSVGSSTSYASGANSYSTTYYWRVYASNSFGNSSWTSIRSFTTEAVPVPGTPTLSSPADAATVQTPDLSLSWGSVTYATDYHLQVSVNSDCSSPLYDANTSGSTSVSSGGWSAYSTTYYWRVYASNVSGNSSYSAIRSFTTKMPVPTATPATNIASNSFNANWNSVTLATNYYLDVGTTSGGTDILNNQVTGDVSTYKITGLFSAKQYFYQIRATNAGETTTTSNVISLYTISSGTVLLGSGKGLSGGIQRLGKNKGIN